MADRMITAHRQYPWMTVWTILLGHMTVTHGYSSGAPNTEAVCSDMFPVGHQRNAQVSVTPPFTLYLSQTVYTEWERLRVTLKAESGTFRGFMLQARRANCRHPDRQEALGVFRILSGEDEAWSIQVKPCGADKINNTVTHRLDRDRKSITVEWFAPGTLQGHIYFVATVVQNQHTFWTTIYSEILRDMSSGSQPVICPARMLLDPTAPLPSTTPKTTSTSKTSPTSKTEGLSGIASPTPSLSLSLVVIACILLSFSTSI